MSMGDSLTEVYVYENTQLLEQLEEMLLDSEKNTVLEKSHIDEIFRVMHTIKGSSAMMGYDGLTQLAHGMEDMFAALRQNLDAPKEAWELIISLVLECVDFFKNEISKVQSGLLPDGEIAPLHTRALELLSVISDQPAAAEVASHAIVLPGDPISPVVPGTADASDGNGNAFHYYKAKLFFTNGCAMESVRAFAVVNSLDGLYTRIAHMPKDLNVNCDEAIISHGFLLYLESPYASHEVESRLSDTMFLQSLEFSELSSEEALPLLAGAVQTSVAAPSASQPAPSVENAKNSGREERQAPEQDGKDAAANAPRSITHNFLSVNVGKVDKLMDLVGEIVTTESMVIKHPQVVDLHIESFEKQSRRLRQLTDELQDVVMSIRMVPISSTFRKMQRIVRDMSHKTGKEAELVLLGEQTEVDKNVIENLSDPLMHMIRNSMDHGLEPTEERLAKGKPAVGTIVLEARNTGGDVIITVTDDGQGLDREKLIKTAQEKGLTQKSESEISDREAYNFILLPGFSTNEQVTEFSGRGVGMDVVCSNVEKMGGTVSMDSEPGKSTTFTLQIPLTLAIIDGMDVQVGTEHYIIPILNIRESFELQPKDLIVAPDGTESIIIRGKCFLVRRLHQLFSVQTSKQGLQDGIMVLVESERGSICLFVDQIVGEQQAVIKPLPNFISRMLGRLPYISGCTILGNGSISLILDVNSLTSNAAV
ncbi:MAG: chemotaxis protein CheA [Candidatus Pelethousia sp.]|nr:chemotaxis protein CheA [Candidatus Pelethousia sp.]